MRKFDRSWGYWRPDDRGIVEMGFWSGDYCPDLKTHFHDEAQLAFILSGRRSFLVGGAVLTASAGQCAYIPAGTPHRPIAANRETVCLNIYVAAAAKPFAAIVDIESGWRAGDAALSDLVRTCLDRLPAAPVPDTVRSSPPCTLHASLRVRDIAARKGVSREYFSRRFAQDVGMPPHAFRLAGRLNRARRLLRAGEPVAAVAAETGFADQSHLGRHFRHYFGATPGVYSHG